MSEIRKERAFDGRCTVFAGSGLIISNLSDDTADHLVAQLVGATPSGRDLRRVGGRGFEASAKARAGSRALGRREK